MLAGVGVHAAMREADEQIEVGDPCVVFEDCAVVVKVPKHELV
jgi:hypothetical protein